MTLYAHAAVNEDHEIVPEVTGSRMDPFEYATRVARVKLDAKIIDALSELGSCLDEATVRVHCQPLPKCDLCGDDAQWQAESYTLGYYVKLCHDCQQSFIDKYKSFERIQH